MTKPEPRQPRQHGTYHPDTARAAFDARYPAYQYCMVEFLTEHLADVSRTFEGDLQEALVLAVIGQMYLRAHMAQAQSHPAAALDASISASRIADVTGIPRQTVRRKLQALEARGWIERTSTAAFRLVVRDGSSNAREDLDGLDRRGVDRAARLFCGLQKVLATPVPQQD